MEALQLKSADHRKHSTRRNTAEPASCRFSGQHKSHKYPPESEVCCSVPSKQQLFAGDTSPWTTSTTSQMCHFVHSNPVRFQSPDLCLLSPFSLLIQANLHQHCYTEPIPVGSYLSAGTSPVRAGQKSITGGPGSIPIKDI